MAKLQTAQNLNYGMPLQVNFLYFLATSSSS